MNYPPQALWGSLLQLTCGLQGNARGQPLTLTKGKTMKYLPLLLILCFANPVEAARAHLEADYQRVWCTDKGGTAESPVPEANFTNLIKTTNRTRVDCLLTEYAIEFDFADKWAEAIGQALYYGEATNRTPGIVLIMENPVRDLKYLIRMFRAIQSSGIKIRVWVVQ